MITLTKIVRGSYWFDEEGKVDLDPDSIESLHGYYDFTPGGSRTWAGTLIRTKGGYEHLVRETQDKIRTLMNPGPKPPADKAGL